MPRNRSEKGPPPTGTLSNGTKIWRDGNGRFHRDNGPAIERPSGNNRWYRHGTYHREGGPAVISKDGYRAWYRGGVLHRDDGPAVEDPAVGNGCIYKAWYIDGELIRDEELPHGA